MLDDNFNAEWARMKNEFAAREREQDQRAFEAKLEAEEKLNEPLVGVKVSEPAKFVTAGCALFTVLNTQTGNRFTFKVSKHDKEENFFWVGVLRGPQNTSDYTCVGRIVNGKYIHNRSSKISETAQSNKVFDWFWRNLNTTGGLPSFIEVYHCGFCCVCGRLLTTPESIQAGIGPVCSGR